MKALITGGSGFVGKYLAAECSAAGDDVVSIDRSGDDPLDITDRDAIHDALARHRPEVVYHLAALSHVGESWDDPTRVLRVNVEGTANVLDGARAAEVRRVVVVGSAEEYGRVDERDLPLREDAPLRPTSPYGVSKIAASFLALQAHLAYGFDVVRVRAFSHTGPGQSDRFLVPALAQRIAQAERDGSDEIRVGSLDPVRDLSDVRDVVRRTGCSPCTVTPAACTTCAPERACRCARSQTASSARPTVRCGSPSTRRSCARWRFLVSSATRRAYAPIPAGRPTTRSTRRSPRCSPALAPRKAETRLDGHRHPR